MGLLAAGMQRGRMPRCRHAGQAARLCDRDVPEGTETTMDTLNPRRIFACAMLLLASSIASAVAADTVDMAAAKKEGKVVWYCSVPVETAQKVANLFEQKTSIKVELFRSGGSAILRRFQQA